MTGTAYPGALDDTSGDIPLTGANPDIYLGSTVDSVVDFTHPTHHERLAGATEALEAKVGIGASTPVAGRQLRGTGTGTSKWTGIKQVVIESTGGAMSTIINAAIQEQTGACELLFPDETYLINEQIVIDRDNIILRGNGGAITPSSTGRTLFFVSANIAGPAILFDKDPGGTPESGPTPDEVVSGGGLSHIHLDGNDTTGDGIGIVTARSLYFHDFSVNRFDGNAIEFGNHGTAAGGDDTYDSNSGLRFTRFTIAQSTGTGLYITGNTYACSFTDFGITITGSGVGIDLHGVDDIWFDNAGVLTQDAAGTNIRLTGVDYGSKTATAVIFGKTLCNGVGTLYRFIGDDFDSATRRTLILGLGTEDHTSQPFTADKGSMPSYIDVDGRHNLRHDPRTTCLIQDDFTGGALTTGAIGDLGWSLANGVVTLFTVAANHPGIRRLSTPASTAITAIGIPAGSTNGLMLPSEQFDATFIFKTASTDSDTMIRIGFGLQWDADPPDHGIYLEKLYGDTQWFAVCRASGTQTRSTAIENVVINGWVRLRIRRHNNATIGFSIGDTVNDNDDKRITTNIPTSALCAIYQVRSQSGTAKTLDIDYFQLLVTGMSR